VCNAALYHACAAAHTKNNSKQGDSVLIKVPFHSRKEKVDLVIFEMFASHGSTIGRSTIDSIEWGGLIAGALYMSGLNTDHVGWLANATWRNLVAGRTSATESQAGQAIREWIWAYYNDPAHPERLIHLGGGKDKLKGITKNPGPLFGMASHSWSALGLAVGYHRWSFMAEQAKLMGHKAPQVPLVTKTQMQRPQENQRSSQSIYV